ncbi:MAG: PepSY domain-containing protein [Beijerinckiaceae bacterium]
MGGYRFPMRMWLLSLSAAILLAGFAPARAEAHCFTPEETREHVQRHGLIALNEVVRSARGGAKADLISARLCETAEKLVYMIAMLGRDGKVVRLIVDARSGDVINHR